jgi:hypothetical protein
MRYLITFILLGLVFYNCERVVDIPEIESGNPSLIIEATLTDRLENQMARVSYSTGLNDSVSCKIVENAKVSLVSSIGDTINYLYISNGWYQSPVFQAKKGVIYNMEVNIDSIRYVAKGEIFGDRYLDTLYYKHLEHTLYQDEGYYVYFNISKKVSDSINYYLVDTWKNGNYLTNGSNILLFSDQYQTTLYDLKMPFTFSANDTIDVELSLISKEMFDYYLFIGSKLFSVNISSIGYISNPKVQFSPEALGYFQVSQATKKRIIIK